MQKKTYFTFLLSLLFTSTQLFGQSSGQIKGQVTLEDGEPAAFATVMLMNVADTTMVKANSTAENGQYELLAAPSGDYFVQVSYVGFDNLNSEAFSYTEGQEHIVPSISMATTSQQLEEVVVKGTRPIVEVHPDKTVFNVEGSVNATGNTALELLRKSPGVVVTNNDEIILAGKNGVQIYIDGKPSPLSADDLANYLKTMQSSEIDNIEIITNPSAKYDAEGNAGIINIRLKKDKSLGTNGSVNAGFRYGLRPKYEGSLSLNNRTRNVNVFGSYGYFNGEFENSFDIYREQGTESFDQTNLMVSSDETHNFKFGTDFFVSDKSTIGVLVSGNVNDNTNTGKSVTNIAPLGSGEFDQILDASNDQTGERNSLNFNLNYAYRGDNNSTWNFDVDYGRFRNDGTSYQPNTYFTGDHTQIISERIFSAVTPTDINIYTAKFDHERNLLGGKLGFGAKVSLVETDNTFDFFDIVDGSRILNTDRSNNFVFEENINAGYFSFQRPLGEKVNLMLGLRMENTHSTGTLSSVQQGNDDVVDRNYTDWFPSAGLTFQLDPKNSLRLNYSRRIDRPSYQDLNPFEFKLDELAFQKGNAFLTPQYSNSYSLTHTFNYRLNTSISFTQTNDVFTRITKALDERTSILTFENLAKQTNLALTVSYPFSLTKWWSVYSNVTAYRLHNEAVIDGDEIDLNANVLSFYMQNSFSLPKGYKFEISGFYNSPSLWEGNWTTRSIYSVEAGVQKKIMQDRGTLKLTFSDIFFTQRWKGESTFGDLFISGGGQWESQQLRINFSYLFGNKQVKSTRKRKTGLEDEQRRIKTQD